MEIRPYSDGDHDTVVALWREVFPDASPWNEPSAVIAAKRTVQPELFILALEGGELVGTAMGGFDGRRGWVYSVAVAPKRRRLGVGTALMKSVEERLGRMGCPKLNLQVRGANEGAVEFYKSLGYSVEDRVSMGKLIER